MRARMYVSQRTGTGRLRYLCQHPTVYLLRSVLAQRKQDQEGGRYRVPQMYRLVRRPLHFVYENSHPPPHHNIYIYMYVYNEKKIRKKSPIIVLMKKCTMHLEIIVQVT